MTITRLENTSHPANHLADPKLEREARKLSRGRVTKKKMGWLLAKVESHKITREEFSAVLRRALMSEYDTAVAPKVVFVPAPSATRH